jgi:hypothetical protein
MHADADTAATLRRGVPLSFLYLLSNYDISNYEGMQGTLTQRSVHGLSCTLACTFAHVLDDASNDLSGQPNSQDLQDLIVNYEDSRHYAIAAYRERRLQYWSTPKRIG